MQPTGTMNLGARFVEANHASRLVDHGEKYPGMSDTTRQTGRPVAEDRRVPGLDPTTGAGPRADVRGNPLEELAIQLTERGCRATVRGGTPVVSLDVHGERVSACAGGWSRWGDEHGTVLGRVSDVGAAADAAVKVLELAAVRGSSGAGPGRKRAVGAVESDSR